jgi:hypothetical protein
MAVCAGGVAGRSGGLSGALMPADIGNRPRGKQQKETTMTRQDLIAAIKQAAADAAAGKNVAQDLNRLLRDVRETGVKQ